MVESIERNPIARLVLNTARFVLETVDKLDPDHSIIFTNRKTGEKIVIPGRDLNTNFIIKYELHLKDSPVKS